MNTPETAWPSVNTDLAETVVPAPESLRPWLTELGRIPAVRELSEPFAHLPQATTMIVLRTEDHGPRDALVLGPRTKASYAKADKPLGCLRLRLAAGATPALLGVRAADLTDRVVRLADLPGPAAELAAELTQLHPDELLHYLEQRLPHRVRESPTQRSHRGLLHRAVGTVSTQPADRTVPVLAHSLAVSERQLRNMFIAGIGVSPKHYARIERVRRVLTQAGHSPWSQLAVRAGYYDHSHMTAEFRTLMGVTPSSFLSGTRPPADPCRPLIRG
ncbi:helix-turn-helix domain-containing protein [Nocardia speluncae]|uniref:helix-turn-helix domain-containing protein n=1 Tax=Nocardia speluncae TaxID=419477 RepID=UPI000A035AEF|nr:AraC family transcriptional regulator [Nocardia speluncae]